MTPPPTDPETRALRSRLAARSRIDEHGCWRWLGAHGPSGNGQARYRGRLHTAHRLAAWAFLAHPLVAAEPVGHKGGCAADCINPEHLVVGAAAPRGERNGRAKMDEPTARAIVTALRRGRETDPEIAARLGVTERMVGNVRTRAAWGHLWEEYD